MWNVLVILSNIAIDIIMSNLHKSQLAVKDCYILIKDIELFISKCTPRTEA